MIAIFFVLFSGHLIFSQTIEIQTVQGDTMEIETKTSQITNKGVKSSVGVVIPYSTMTKASTSDFDIFEKLMNKTSKRAYQHVEIVFTGDENAYAKRLERLKSNRTGADVARTAGGMMTIIGILSGDRGLTAMGVATNAAGHVAHNINDDRTADTQTAMVNDLDRRTEEQQAAAIEEKVESDEEWMRKEYGKENVDGLIELVDGDHDKAMAYANVAELSKDANHRLSAMWLKAMIEEDRKDKEESKKYFEQLVTFDPEIKDIKEAEKEVHMLLEEVEDLRDQE
jgi:tetratricopeptide (TPR) repeat protein